MAKKSKMVEEIIQFYKAYVHLFLRFGLTEARFYNWFDTFQKYPDVGKVYKFIFTGPESLFVLTIIADKIWRRSKPLVWKQLPTISPKHPELVELQRAVTKIRKTWGRRPHAISQAQRTTRTKSSKPTYKTYGDQGLVSDETGSR